MTHQPTVHHSEACTQRERAEGVQLMVRDVQSAIANCPYAPIRALNCERRDCGLLLFGQVPSFYLKQVAIALVTKHLRTGVPFDIDIEVA